MGTQIDTTGNYIRLSMELRAFLLEKLSKQPLILTCYFFSFVLFLVIVMVMYICLLIYFNFLIFHRRNVRPKRIKFYERDD